MDSISVAVRLPLALASLLLPTVVAAQEYTQPLCEVAEAPLTVPFPSVPIHVTHHYFASGKYRSSEGLLEIRNEGESPIIGLLAIVEYSDAAGRNAFQISFKAVSAGREGLLNAAVHNDYDDPLELTAPVAPGKTVSLGAESFLITPVCPAAARLVFLQLASESNEVKQWCVPGWRTGPAVKQSPAYELTIHMKGMNLPFAMGVTARIDANGRIRAVIPGEHSDVVWLQDLKKDLQENLSYCPALHGGKPAGSELNLSLRFVKSGTGELWPPDVAQLGVLLVFEQDKSNPNLWRLRYGPS